MTTEVLPPDISKAIEQVTFYNKTKTEGLKVAFEQCSLRGFLTPTDFYAMKCNWFDPVEEIARMDGLPQPHVRDLLGRIPFEQVVAALFNQAARLDADARRGTV